MVASIQCTMMNKALEAYLRDLSQRGRATKTLHQRRAMLGRFNDFLKREARVIHPNRLTLEDARAFISQLAGPVTQYPSHAIRSPRSNVGYSAHTLRTYVSTLRTFSRWLQQQGYCREPIFAALEMPELSRASATPLARPDWLRMLAHINRKTVRGTRLYAIIVLLTEGGLSSRDLVNMRLRDWDGQCVILRKRNQTQRLIPLSSESQRAMTAYLKNARGISCSDFLILSETGAPLTTNALTQILRRLARRCGIDGLDARALRRLGAISSRIQPAE